MDERKKLLLSFYKQLKETPPTTVKRGLSTYRTYRSGGLALSLREKRGEEGIVGLTFPLLGESLHLLASGKFTYSDEEGTSYELEDELMCAALEEHLRWRLAFLQRFEV